LNEPSPAQGHAIREVIMNHQGAPKGVGFLSNKYTPSEVGVFSMY
jgi:hypothetical protein